jgi:hypothetical protein
MFFHSTEQLKNGTIIKPAQKHQFHVLKLELKNAIIGTKLALLELG